MNEIAKLNANIYRSIQSVLSLKLNGLTMQSGQNDFFYVISKNEGITQKELSNRMGIGKSTTTKVVNQLVKQNFVYRQKDENDKRYERLYLTKNGKEIEPVITSIFNDLIKLVSKDLSQKEIETLESLLRKILKNILEEKNNHDK